MLNATELNKIIEHLNQDFSSLRTNRATPTLVENIIVDAYGTKTPLIQLAGITAPEARTLLIQPWDKSQAKAIIKAITEAKLDLQPQMDQDVIRINLPALTEDKRKELIKLMKEKLEQARITLRHLREETLKQLKKDQKDGSISEDDYFKAEKEIQKQLAETEEQINKISTQKEKEIMTI